jgi:hypothetical protein
MKGAQPWQAFRHGGASAIFTTTVSQSKPLPAALSAIVYALGMFVQ